MVEQRIQQQFYESADLQVQSAETLARPISDASTAVLGAITAGGKVLAYGHAASFVDAQRFVGAFMDRFERERPSLAALTLGGDSALLHAMARDGGAGMSGPALRQLEALGAPGDVLLLVSADGGEPTSGLDGLVGAAHDKDMVVVALTGLRAEKVSSVLIETDVHIPVPHERATRVRETHMLALHCLCDAIDLQLMGEQELE